jgi:hypothetical protein
MLVKLHETGELIRCTLALESQNLATERKSRAAGVGGNNANEVGSLLWKPLLCSLSEIAMKPMVSDTFRSVDP